MAGCDLSSCPLRSYVGKMASDTDEPMFICAKHRYLFSKAVNRYLFSICPRHENTAVNKTWKFLPLWSLHSGVCVYLQILTNISDDKWYRGKIKMNGGRGFPVGLVAKTSCSQCRGPGFGPWSENLIPHAETKSFHATTKRSCLPQWRPEILCATTKT